MAKEGNFSGSVSFEIEATNTKAAFEKLMNECKKADEAKRKEIVDLLLEAAQNTVDDYVKEGMQVSNLGTFKTIIYNAMADGWNKCFQHYESEIWKGRQG